jgi:hypothetical protein
MKKFDPFEYQNVFYEYEVKITNEEINQILTILKHDKFKNEEQSSTFYNLNILNFPVLKNLKEQIIKILNNQNLLLSNNWAQLYNKENEHGLHNHPNSIYSGIIYVNSNSASPTVFYNHIYESYIHNFKKNTLLMFPSHMGHEVKKLNKNEERLIISFNTMKNKT